MLALDNQTLEHSFTFYVPLQLAKKWDNKIDLIHVANKNESSFPFDPFVGNFLQDYMGEAHLVKSKDVGFKLMDFVRSNDYQLLVMVKRAKGFWAKLFTKDHISEEIQRCFVPLLIVPED